MEKGLLKTVELTDEEVDAFKSMVVNPYKVHTLYLHYY